MSTTAEPERATGPAPERTSRDLPVPADFDMLQFLSGTGARLAGSANFIMQLSWPSIGYALVNSRVHDGSAVLHPAKRARTTFTYLAVSMLGTDEDRAAYRRAVNGQHAQVVSEPDEPVEYRAMDPRLQTWVAACLYYGTRDLQEKMHGPLEDAVADAMYLHCARFGTTLQMPATSWPADRAAFDRYWEESLAEVHIDPVVRDFLMGLVTFRHLRGPVRRMAPFNVFITTGFLPPFFREAMGLSWTPRQQARFDLLMRWLGRLERALPAHRRAAPFPRLLEDMRRRRAAGLPLV